RDLEVRCLPTAIPAGIDVDVSALNIGDSIHVRDLSIPEVTILSDPDATVVTVVPPTVMEEKPAEAVEGAEPVAGEPEVITKGKKDEEGAAEAEDKDKGKDRDRDKDKDKDKDKEKEKGKK